MSRSVMILCLNGKRRTVKFTPNTTISQILEDICTKEKIDAPMHELRTSKAILDRTLPWRLTNLPNNAKLELCRSDPDKQKVENVRIALQLPNGQRLTGQFATTAFLSEIIEHFSEQLHSLLNPKPGSVPTIVYMRQNFIGNQPLSSTSLRILGIIKDSALLRFFYQSPPAEEELSTKNHKPIVTATQVDAKVVSKANNSVAANHSITKHVYAISGKQMSLTKQSPNELSSEKTKNMQKVNVAIQDVDMPESSCVDMLDTVARQHNIAISKITTPEEIPPSLSPRSQRKNDVVALLHGTGSKSSESHLRSSKRKKVTPSTSSSSPPNDLSNFKFPTETQGRQIYQPQANERNIDLQCPCERHPKLFHEDVERASSAASDVSDEFFEVTVDDLRKMMADLKHERKKFEEKEMLTEEQRHARKIQLVSRYPNIIIRIVFPDRQILQGIFRPMEKVDALYKFVRKHVTVSSFHLFTTPPKNILKNKERSLYDCNLAPAARVYFSTDEKVDEDGLLKVSTLHLLCTNVEANLALRREVAKASSKRASYTAGEKLTIVEYAEEHGNRSAGRRYNVSETCVRQWRKRKGSLVKLPITKRANRGCKASFPDMENELFNFVLERHAYGVVVHKADVMMHALSLVPKFSNQYPEILNFKASSSWYYRFMSRHGFL